MIECLLFRITGLDALRCQVVKNTVPFFVEASVFNYARGKLRLSADDFESIYGTSESRVECRFEIILTVSLTDHFSNPLRLLYASIGKRVSMVRIVEEGSFVPRDDISR
jgi:hypothetical protein